MQRISMAFWNQQEIAPHRQIAWTRALIFRMIDAYRDEPILWNPQHPNFKHRAKKRSALARIAQDLGLPLPAVRQKIDVLKGTFQKYRRNIQAQGGNPPPKMWFAYERLSFLAPDDQAFEARDVVSVKGEEETTYTISYNGQEEESQVATKPSLLYCPSSSIPTPSVQRSWSERSQTVQEKQQQLQAHKEDTNRRQEQTWANALASIVEVMVRQAGPRPEPEMWQLHDSLFQLLRRFHMGEFAEERLEELSEKSTR